PFCPSLHDALPICMKRLDSSKSSPSNICTSPKAPSVQTLNTCVCPLVNKPEPCVRGKIPTREDKGRISSGCLLSGRTFLSVIKRRPSYLNISYKVIITLLMVTYSSYFQTYIS